MMGVEKEIEKLFNDIKEILRERVKLINLYSSLCYQLGEKNRRDEINMGLNEIEISMALINAYLRKSIDTLIRLNKTAETVKYTKELRELLNSTFDE